jgi:hypothetical protein
MLINNNNIHIFAGEALTNVSNTSFFDNFNTWMPVQWQDLFRYPDMCNSSSPFVIRINVKNLPV